MQREKKYAVSAPKTPNCKVGRLNAIATALMAFSVAVAYANSLHLWETTRHLATQMNALQDSPVFRIVEAGSAIGEPIRTVLRQPGILSQCLTFDPST